MNTKNIEPLQVWTPAGNKEATILSLYNFSDYHFDNGGGKVHYKLIGMENVVTTNEEGTEISTPVAFDYFKGIIDIPSNVIQQWGSSDDIIWQYVASNINVIIL